MERTGGRRRVEGIEMQSQSLYNFDCTCGAVIITPKTEGVCTCGRAYRIEWQAKIETKKDVKTSQRRRDCE